MFIKILGLPEFEQSLLGIDNRGIALLNTSVANSLGQALQSSIPGSQLRRGTVTIAEIQQIFGYIPAIHDAHWDHNQPNLTAWEQWLETTSEDTLLELFDRLFSADSQDPFMADGAPSPEAIADYFRTYATQEMTARELSDAISSHPDTLLAANLLKEDVLAFLQSHGLAPSEHNLKIIEEDIRLLFGQGHEHRTAMYEILRQRFPWSNLEPMWTKV